jgi:hypothetical protein
MEPNLGHRDDGIPAADPGAGAPEPSEGFGIAGEEPERPEEPDVEADAREADGSGDDPPFRTPDPGDVSRR